MFILFDVGGTKIRIAAADQNGFLGDPVIMLTPSDFDEGLQMITDAALGMTKGEKITAVVGGLAGTLDRNHMMLVYGLNVSSWAGKPIKMLLEKSFNAPVVLENDAALAGLGEAVEGAGKNYEIVGYMTVSTGVGGARITDKKIDRHAFGFEPGYQIIDADGTLCTRCTRRDLQAHISGKGIEEHTGHKAEEITDQTMWEDIARHLSFGLTNTIVHWSPNVMVLGGSVMQSVSIERVNELVKENLYVYPEIPPIVRAELGDVGGLHGALHLARTMSV
ncbi:MAG: ROK family protein [bacterium]|nr:ROK family protein [bacterium]